MVSTKDTKPVTSPAPKPEPKAEPNVRREDARSKPVERPFITAATKHEIEQYGESIDPFTGERLTKSDL